MSIQKILQFLLLRVTPFSLMLITAFVLLLNIPNGRDVSTFAPQLILYLLLTAGTLRFGALLSQGELSPAHMIGFIAFLSLPINAIPSMVWALFFGGILGSLLMMTRGQLVSAIRKRLPVDMNNVIFTTARVTLSYWAAGQVYLAAGGRLPLGRIPDDISLIVLPITIYGLVYMTLYVSIFLLELYVRGAQVGQIIRTDLSRIFGIVVLPMPFAILGAEIFRVLSTASQAVFLAGLVFGVIILYTLSLSEYRLRKQLNELRTLSVVTQAMRAHLDLDGLLRTIYVQIAYLLDIQNFMVVLYDLEERRLNFPLVIRRGQEEAATVARTINYENTLMGYILKTETPLLIAGDVAEKARELGVQPPDSATESWLGVPLLAGGRCLGVIIVTSDDPDRQFTPDDLRLLNIVTASSSIAVENAQLYRQQTERASQLITLNRVSALLSGTLSPDTVLDTIISSASAISSANAVSVYLYWDDARSTLPLVRSAGLSDQFALNPPDPLLPSHPADPTQPPVAVVISDVVTDQRAEPLREVIVKEHKSALIELPLVAGDDRLGVLVMYYDEPQVFTGDKVELLKTFASQAAQAINNARLYATTDEAFQRSVEQLLALAGIGRLLTSTIDLKTICDLVLSHATEATKVETAMVVLREEQTGTPKIITARGYPDEFVRTFAPARTTSITRYVLETGQPYIADDVRTDENFYSAVPGVMSQLSVPVLRGKETLGVITLESDRPNGFTAEDAHFVAQIANQAVIAIDNARLFMRITEARDRLQVLLDAMEEGIMLIDNRGKIALANPSIDLIGLNPDQVINRNLLELLHDPELKLIERTGFASLKDVVEVFETMEDLSVHPHVMYVVQGEYGALHIRRQIIPVRDGQGKNIGILLVFYNKTEEQELARSREELSRMIVHDLRSPLTAVTTSLKLISEFIPANSDFRPAVMETTDASRRAIRKVLSRVDSLLDIAKMESGQLNIDTEVTDLTSLATNVRAELYPLAHELEIDIVLDIDSAIPPLNIDGDKIERLMLNLVDNALKYSPRESNIIIRSYLMNGDGIRPGYVRVDVVDHGPGIPQEYKESLFDSFVQIQGRRKVRRGVGLGLTFCRMVTEAHGGRIWIEDNPKGGSIFAFTLPMAETPREVKKVK